MTADSQTTGSQRPVSSILMPSEQKRKSQKRKKTAHIFRKSMGAFLNAFSARGSGKYSPKDLAKEREEYRRNHPSDEEEDYYVYYGDPQQIQSAAVTTKQEEERVTMTHNALNPEFMHSVNVQNVNGHRSPSNGVHTVQQAPGSAIGSGPLSPTVTVQSTKSAVIHRGVEVEVFFEDETRVIVTAEVSVRAIELVSRALEQRGVSTSMAHLFALCVKEGNPAAAHERMTTVEDTATPIASMPTFVNALNLTTPKLVVCYKQSSAQ